MRNEHDREREMNELIDAYLDGELTQADQQRVRIYLEDTPEAMERFRELSALKQLTSTLAFVPPPEDRMAELDARLSVQAPRRMGWILLVLSVVGLLLFVGYRFALDPGIPVLVKALYGGMVLGGALLLGSVGRQRWLELPHDRYRGVKK